MMMAPPNYSRMMAPQVMFSVASLLSSSLPGLLHGAIFSTTRADSPHANASSEDDLDEFAWPLDGASSTSATSADSASQPTGESTRFLQIITSGYSASPDDGVDDWDWPSACVSQPIAEAPGILATLVTRVIAAIEVLAAGLGVSSALRATRISRVFQTRVPAKPLPTAPVPRQPTPSALALRQSPLTTIVLRSVRAAQVESKRRREAYRQRMRRLLREDVVLRRDIALFRQTQENNRLHRELQQIAQTPRYSSHRPAVQCVARTTSMHQSCRRLRTRISVGHCRV